MGESRLGISRPPELVKIPPIADCFRTSAKLHRRLLGNRRVPACQVNFASSQCFSDLHTTIGTDGTRARGYASLTQDAERKGENEI